LNKPEDHADAEKYPRILDIGYEAEEHGGQSEEEHAANECVLETNHAKIIPDERG
jgi:hypothetical protein